METIKQTISNKIIISPFVNNDREMSQILEGKLKEDLVLF